MAISALDAILTVGGKAHPLMGHIFTGRPTSASLGATCSMCIGDSPAIADTVIQDSHGNAVHLCLPHELLLHRAFETDKTGRSGVDEYEAEILAEILYTVSRPGWMPVPVYKALTRRAQKKARLLAILSILPKARPFLDTRTSTPTD